MDNKPDQPTTEERLLVVMRRWRAEGAHWTSDLSGALRLPTPVVRRALLRMDAAGTVRRVVKGHPTSWKLDHDQ